VGELLRKKKIDFKGGNSKKKKEGEEQRREGSNVSAEVLDQKRDHHGAALNGKKARRVGKGKNNQSRGKALLRTNSGAAVNRPIETKKFHSSF